ncbi:plasminogen [Diabrotica undecimpunctata]|uniref:plasminogen n=1 Tax=Diabrotica undecimpunctata TaxID=50387 RepID=UPI003B63B5D2
MSGLVLVSLIVFNLGYVINYKSSNHHHENWTKDSDLDSMFFETPRHYYNNHTQEYSDWSFWSRCSHCLQRRMKECISPACDGSRIYEERPCNKKRCKRKNKQKEKFQIVHLDVNSNYLMKQAPSDIWSRWSEWSPCNRNCRTFRNRKCKKPSRCGKQVQKEHAYCYHSKTNCEVYVLNLLEQSRNTDARRYHYDSNNQNSTQRQSRKRRRNRRCGVPARKSKMLKIIGGIEARKYKWPWHVAILNQFREVFCGGTLISNRWVLTANHCIRRYLRVRLNAHDLRATDGSDVEMTVYKMFPHPKFNYKTVDNDIALLMLPRAVNTPIACLPARKPKTRQVCSVMGWGKVDPEDVYGVPVLHEAKLPIVHQKTCRRSYKQFLISDNMLCAGWYSGRADTCAGDSGGGLMCPTKRNKRLIYSIQGITSFGDGCGRRQKYGIYTTVYNYIGWIKYIIDHYS